MSKLLIQPYELELRSENQIKILWNEGARQRSISDFKNLEHILSKKEKIYLIPNKNLLNSKNILEWFDRLVKYNKGILEKNIIKRFLTEKGFHVDAQQNFGYQTVMKWYNKVEDFVTTKTKFDG